MPFVVKRIPLVLMVLIISLFSIFISSYANLTEIAFGCVLIAVIFMIIKISEQHLLFVITCLLPFVYIPLELTKGVYISFTFVIMFSSLILFLKYRKLFPKIGKIEIITSLFGLYILIRLLIIGVLFEKVSFLTTFNILSSDMAKIVSGIIFFRISRIERFRNDIVLGLIFSMLLMLGFQIYQTITGLSHLLSVGYKFPIFNYNTAKGDMRPFATFLTPVTYGSYLAMVSSFLFWIAVPSKLKLIKWIVFALSIVGLILTETRSAWIAFALSFITVTLLQRSLNWTRILLVSVPLVATIICTILLYPGIFNNFTNRLSTVTDNSYSSNTIRLGLWKGTFQIMRENYITGYGTAEFLDYINKYVTFNLSNISHPHETFLAIFFRYGVVGLIFYCSIFIIFLWQVAKAIRIKDQDLSIKAANNSSLAAVTVFLITSLFETLWGSFNVYCTMFFLMGFGMTMPRKKSET